MGPPGALAVDVSGLLGAIVASFFFLRGGSCDSFSFEGDRLVEDVLGPSPNPEPLGPAGPSEDPSFPSSV